MGILIKREGEFTKLNENKLTNLFFKADAYLDYLPYTLEGPRDLPAASKLVSYAKRFEWEILDLTNFDLTEYPEELWNLTNLKVLLLGSAFNRPQYPFKEHLVNKKILGIPKLVNLLVLSLSRMELSALPDLSGLSKLKLLNFTQSNLKEIPAWLCRMKSIETLYFGYTDLVFIPEEIAHLTNLKRLYLHYTKITEIGSWIGSLTNLVELTLSPLIARLPLEILNLKKLTRLDLSDTLLEQKIPPEILNQSVAGQIHYILQIQQGARQQECNESKMIIVGQGNVGKTCLLKSLTSKAPFDGESKSTEGIDIAPWEFIHNNKKYKLNVWDFGGQEIYHSTHQFFLTQRSLYLFVWDARQEDEYGRIDYWLKTVESLAGSSPIIIVINKCDKDRKSVKNLPLDKYKEKYPQIESVWEVSCKDNINIDLLRNHIIEVAATKLPLMQEKWFESWIAIRNGLQKLKESEKTIAFDAYIEICKQQKIGLQEAKSLLQFLHDLGDVLHYTNNPLMEHTVVLSTDWGTDAAYKILDSQNNLLKDRNGILKYTDLPEIWEDADIYPSEKYDFILELMKRFELIFEIDAKSEYLIPELLKSNKIDIDKRFDRKVCIHFRYVYDFLPAGIMSRFIVKTSELILRDEKGSYLCWKEGTYLLYNQSYARVTLGETGGQKHIDIYVSGENKRVNTELLTIIRERLREINNVFYSLNIQEKIPCKCCDTCSYMFSYEYLLRAESKNKAFVDCQSSADDVSIAELLEGIPKTNSAFDYKEKNIFEKLTAPVLNKKTVLVMVSTAEEEQDILTAEPDEWGEIAYKTGINTFSYCRKEKNNIIFILGRGIKMGGDSASSMLSEIANQTNPDFLAMAGFCAGNKQEARIGDVVIARKICSVEKGKQTGSSILQKEVEAFELDPSWLQYIEKHLINEKWRDQINFQDKKIVIPIDFEYEYKKLFYSFTDNDALNVCELQKKFQNWQNIYNKAIGEGLVKLKGTSILLTAEGRSALNKLMAENAVLHDVKPQTYVGVFATCYQVKAWEGIFQKLKETYDRKICALDMELSSIANEALKRSLKCLCVKGVGDYADQDKAKSNKYGRPYAVYSSYKFVEKFFIDWLK